MQTGQNKQQASFCRQACRSSGISRIRNIIQATSKVKVWFVRSHKYSFLLSIRGAPKRSHVRFPPNLSLKRRCCMRPMKRDPYHWLRQSLKRPKPRNSTDTAVCFYPHVYYTSIRVAFWPFSLQSGSFPMRSRGPGMKETRQIFVQDLILYQGQPLIYIMSFMGSGGEREARVCVNRNESDWVLVDVITQQPSLPGIFAL